MAKKPVKRAAKRPARSVAAKRPAPRASKRPTPKASKRPASRAAKRAPARKPAPAKTRPSAPAAKATGAPSAKAGGRPPRPAGMSWMSPYLTVRDANAALGFYEKAFGFKKKNTVVGGDGRVRHAEMTHHDCVLMFGSFGAPPAGGSPCPISLYVYCDDVVALFHRASAAGATVIHPPKEMFYGDNVCSLQDPDGYTWNFATNVADFDPSKSPF